MPNKLPIFILKLFISIILVTFVFSAILVEVEDVIKNTFANIYEYASPDSQKNAVDKFESVCSSEDKSQGAFLGIQLCNDLSLRADLEDNCETYKELKRKNEVVVDEELEKICGDLEGGKFDKFCEKQEKSILIPDFKGMEKACAEYKAGTIEGKEFFVNYIGSAYGNIEVSKSNFFSSYKDTIRYFEAHSTLYIFVLVFLIWLLYLLIKDLSLVFTILGNILFNISLFLLIPFFIISSYVNTVGIQTDSLLSLFSEGGTSLQANIIVSLFLIALLSFYNKALITRAIIFFIIGGIGKLHRYMIRTGKEVKKKKVKENNKNKDMLNRILPKIVKSMLESFNS